jgi:hypothetical protein
MFFFFFNLSKVFSTRYQGKVILLSVNEKAGIEQLKQERFSLLTYIQERISLFYIGGQLSLRSSRLRNVLESVDRRA